MPSYTIKQVPADLLDKLKERAEITGRSVNKEIIACLESVVMPRRQTPQEIIAERRALWDSLGLKDVPRYDPAWKEEGRR